MEYKKITNDVFWSKPRETNLISHEMILLFSVNRAEVPQDQSVTPRPYSHRVFFNER